MAKYSTRDGRVIVETTDEEDVVIMLTEFIVDMDDPATYARAQMLKMGTGLANIFSVLEMSLCQEYGEGAHNALKAVLMKRQSVCERGSQMLGVPEDDVEFVRETANSVAEMRVHGDALKGKQVSQAEREIEKKVNDLDFGRDLPGYL